MGFLIAIDLKAINKLFCIINCKIKGMVRYRVPCFPNLPDPRSAARNTVLAAWIFTFFPFSPCFHSALFFGIFVSGSSFFNSYLQFSSSPPVFCHSKFLHLGAFLVIILLLSVFVVAFFFFFFARERGWRRVTSSNEPVSLAGLGKNDQPGLTQISLGLIVSQYICTLRWACGKEQLIPMPSRACPEVPWKPLAPLCWILLTFPGTAQQWNFSAHYPAIEGSL